MDTLTPIPTPPAQRWREFRIQTLPIVTFLVVMVCVGMLWKQYVLPTNIIGEVEAVRANLISTVPGTLKELKVSRFDRVTNGQVIAVISTMDTETFQASLRSIEADLKLMRARMQLDMERNAATYEGMRLDLLQERVDLAIERVNNKYYESEVIRQRQLLTNTPVLIDMTTYEYWVRLAETTRTNIVEREKYLAEKEKALPALAPLHLRHPMALVVDLDPGARAIDRCRTCDAVPGGRHAASAFPRHVTPPRGKLGSDPAGLTPSGAYGLWGQTR